MEKEQLIKWLTEKWILGNNLNEFEKGYNTYISNLIYCIEHHIELAPHYQPITK